MYRGTGFGVIILSNALLWNGIILRNTQPPMEAALDCVNYLTCNVSTNFVLDI